MSDGGEPAPQSPYAGVAWAPRRGLLAAAIALAILLFALILGVGAKLHLTFLFPVAAVTALAVLGLGSWAARRYRQTLVEGCAAAREGVFVGGRHLVKRSSIQAAQLERDADGFWLVHVHARFGGVVTLGVKDQGDGKALIDALELDAGSATSRFVMMRRSYSKAALVAPMLLPLLTLLALPWLHLPRLVDAGIVALATATMALVGVSRMLQVVIGADGLLVRERGLGRPRFIAHDAIVDVTREGADVLVRLRAGDALRFPLGFARRPGQPPSAETEGMAEGLLRRIQEARGVFAARGGGAPALAALARDGRTTPEWLGALRRAGEEAEGGFRDALAGRDRLWALAVGAQTPSRTRVAAAVALRVAAQADDDTRGRLAAIAASCASPELAARLRVAADGDDEDVESLLDEVEPRARRAT